MNYTALCSPSARGRHKVLTVHMKPETLPLPLPLVVHAPRSHLLSLSALCESKWHCHWWFMLPAAILSLAALCECCSWVWSKWHCHWWITLPAVILTVTWCAAEWRKLSSVRKSSSACNVNDFVEVILLISNWNVQLPAHPHQDRLHWWQACSHLKGVKRVPFQGHVQVQRRWHMLQNLHFKQFVIAIGVTFSQADFNIMITSIVHWNLLFLHQRVESSSTALQFCNKRFFILFFTTSF